MKKYTVDFGKIDATDETQAVLLRLLEKDHTVLHGGQGHFEAYVKLAAKNMAKNVPMWDQRKKADVWENQDITPAKEIGKTDLGEIFTARDDKPILNKRETGYLKLYLDGGTNNEICDAINIKHKTSGARVRKAIVRKLKDWTKKDDTLADVLWSDIDKGSRLTSKDISDLRHRILPLSSAQRAENDEDALNSTMPVKNIPVSVDYCPLKKRYSGKITAPVMAMPAKKPDMAWYALPIDLDCLSLTYRSRVTERAALINSVEQAHQPDQPAPKKLRHYRDMPEKISGMVASENVKMDYYQTDLRLINR